MDSHHALFGQSIIAGERTTGTAGSLYAQSPGTGVNLDPAYSLIDEHQLVSATAAAAEAFDTFGFLEPEHHARFLERIADHIASSAAVLTERYMAETGLPQARAHGERARTEHQLRLFAAVVRNGEHRGVRIDSGDPQRAPLPRPDLRQRKIPLGPVAVFGASNFPLAFSVAGGDTASALAAGCPVVFKAHNAHPGTSEIIGDAITRAVADFDLHPGVFSLVYGPGSTIGQALVADPEITAVGFTGSRAGGTALMKAASARPHPIPVYAEMSSINPVVVLPGALQTRAAELAQGYVTSITGSAGQLCTVPGVIFVPEGRAGDAFVSAVGKEIDSRAGTTMLTAGIHDAREAGIRLLEAQSGITLVGQGPDGPGLHAPGPVVYSCSTEVFSRNAVLQEEIFGAVSLMVRYASTTELISSLRALEGQLTATLQLGDEDDALAQELIPTLERRAGRILANGWPTGVEVGHAVVHGGPFPATSDSRTTSVGTLAIDRFLRPVAYQSTPETLLPAPVQSKNPWGVPRELDGERPWK